MNRKIGLWLISAVHAIFLIWLTYYWHKQPFLYDEELTLLRISSYFKRLALNIDEKPDLNEYLFVDISWEKMLVEKYDEYGFPIGFESVTNRKSILEFVERINHFDEKPKFLINDIFFDVQTEYDKQLEIELNKLDNVFCVSLYDTQLDTIFKPVLNVSTATTSFETSEGIFLKTKLVFDDTMQTLPVKLYQRLNGKLIHNKDQLDWKQFKINLNTYVVDHRIRRYNLYSGDAARKLYLSELLLLDNTSIENIIKNKIVIVGDYEDNDIVETIYGDMPGPLILVNIYESILNKDYQISAFFVLYLFVGYFIISFICFSDNSFFDSITDKIASKYKINADLLSFGGYLIYFFLMSFVAYMTFDFILTILLFSLYMEIFEKIKTLFQQYVLSYFFKLNS